MSSNIVIPVDFDDLTPIEVKVPIGGKNYTLREGSGGAIKRYSNAKLSKMTLKDGKPVSLNGMADTEAFLVSLCLFDEDGRNVSVETIEAWPNRVKEWLFDTAKKISKLDQDKSLPTLLKERDEITEEIEKLQAEALAGNGQSASSTGAGSDSHLISE